MATLPEDYPTPTLATAYAGYGLGWVVGGYAGHAMLSHCSQVTAYVTVDHRCHVRCCSAAAPTRRRH